MQNISQTQLNIFRQQLEKYVIFTDTEWDIFQQHLNYATYKKKQHFLEAGKVCNYFGFILKGSVRYYYTKDGIELTGYFNYENEFIGAYKSFLTGSIAINNIQTLEPSEIILISKNNMDYDQAGRLKEIRKTIYDNTYNTSTTKIIVHNIYDALGNLLTEKLGQKTDNTGTPIPISTPETDITNFLELQNYSYNIRGWLKGINWLGYGGEQYPTSSTVQPDQNMWFGMDLSYDWGYAINQYNGNIAGQRWVSAGDETERSYGYSYDNAGQLLGADFNQNFLPQNYFDAEWGKNAPSPSNLNIDFSITMGDGNNSNSAYDPNGNILSMRQMGLLINTSTPINELSYNYYPNNANSNTNELQNVVDNANNSKTTLGNFRYSPNYLTMLGGTTKPATATDYTYDANGNLITDLNKDIYSTPPGTGGTPAGAGIVYNYLSLPSSVAIQSMGSVQYTYDADGNMLNKTVQQTGQSAQITDYVGGFEYLNNTLQFFSQEEGRIWRTFVNNAYQYNYDYFIQDHLGNVRTVLTDQVKADPYPTLSFEGSANTKQIAVQDAVWDNSTGDAINVTGVRTALPDGFGSAAANGNYVIDVNKSNGPSIGASKLMKVMTGDKLDVSVQYFYLPGAVNNQNANGASTFLTSILSALTLNPIAVYSPLEGQAASIGSSLTNSTDITNFFSPENSDPNTTDPPKAYLHVLLFDENFVFDAPDSYVEQVASSGTSPGVNGTLPATLASNGPEVVNVMKNGYAYIYFSNESKTDVYFDNLTLVHERSPLVEENQYYPYGLKMSGICSRAFGSLQNRDQYQGDNSEFDETTGWSNFQLRNYDSQIGRWVEQDPDNQFANPYLGMGNNPINNIDEDGGFDGGFGALAGALLGAAAPYIIQGVGQLFNKDFNIDDKGIYSAIGALLGAGIGYASEENWEHNNGFGANFRAFYLGLAGQAGAQVNRWGGVGGTSDANVYAPDIYQGGIQFGVGQVYKWLDAINFDSRIPANNVYTNTPPQRTINVDPIPTDIINALRTDPSASLGLPIVTNLSIPGNVTVNSVSPTGLVTPSIPLGGGRTSFTVFRGGQVLVNPAPGAPPTTSLNSVQFKLRDRAFVMHTRKYISIFGLKIYFGHATF